MIYKEKLKDIRENNNLTQSYMGSLIGVDRKVYNHFESEYTIIPIKHLNTICNYFNVSFDWIFNFTNIKNYSESNEEIDLIASGNRLKEIRKENKLTQDKLANILKADRSTFSKYEKGNNIISTSFLYDLCKKYKISADYLLGKTDYPKYLK